MAPSEDQTRPAGPEGRAAAPRLRRAEVLALGALLAGGTAATSCAAMRPSAPKIVAAGRPPSEGADPAPQAGPSPGALSLDQPASVASGDAFIRYLPAERAWVAGTSRLEERLELQAVENGAVHLIRRALSSSGRQLHLDAPSLAGEDDSSSPHLPLSLPPAQDALGIEIDGDLPDLFPLDHQLRKLDDGTLYAAIRFRRADVDTVFSAEMRLRPGFATVEHRSSVSAVTHGLHLTGLDAATLVVRGGENARWLAAMLDNDGNAFFQRLGRDGQLETETPAQSAARAPVIPLLVLQDATAGEGLFLALRWSTNYRIAAQSLDEQRVVLQAGVRMLGDPLLDPRSAVRADQGFLVLPGQTIAGPWVVLGFFDGGMEDASNTLKEYLTADRPRAPSWAANVMPVTWNSWFAYGSGVQSATMLQEARLARQLGVEVFYVDYGWSAAQGDWVPHPQRFPGRSLRQLADEVHRFGMRFGLWVAFGVADPSSDLLRRHPEFRARQPAPARTGIDGSLPLCLTTAHDWLQQELHRIVREYDLDWLKFDQPMVAACLDRTHPHDRSTRGSLQANNQAFYDLLTSLREDFPELYVESTFDGAGYLDYGVFARSHAAWLDDSAGDPTVPMAVTQQSLYGASFAFPPRFLTLWLARGPIGPGVPGRGFAPDDLAYQGYSTMGGNWGLSLRLGDLDASQRATVRRLIEEYHTLREVLPGARVYHLAPPVAAAPESAPGRSGGLPTLGVSDWFALQYVQPELQRGALLAVRNAAGPDSLTLKLRGLSPTRPYSVQWSDGRELAADTGQALMDAGIPVQLAPYSGGLIWITPTG